MTFLFRQYRYQILDFLFSEVVIIQDKRWYKLIPDLKELIYRIYTLHPFAEQTTLCFANDQKIQKLNCQFRNKNKPTNVLTFEHPDPQSYGGDIILALETIQKESRRARKPMRHHLTHLIFHGLLHLEGYDHLKCNETKIMEMKESYFLGKIGIPNPWKNSFFGSI
ncbi:rRNA maturation RNase YbeY [Commensalibacter melissae]|uniref:rRNA maturation RNase YbeY n=1 Tax=Commensalibacter melissae TaxID=2070537 RepID=UPI000EFD38FF|nr:rRNA maturation RNase YbeY [Commensalibacter melissae]AYN86573.1 rRNA maturation RNase YbeY [Commensalibacter melissae]